MESVNNLLNMAQTTGYKSMPSMQAVIFVAVSVLLLVFGRFVPVIPILLFYAIWGIALLKAGIFALHIRTTIIPIFSLIFVCLLSTFWSDVASITLYNGLAFASMMACVLIVSRVVSSFDFLKGVSLGLAVVSLVTLLSGEYSTVFATGKPALVGFFGQKNTVGVLSAMGLLAGILMVFYSRNWKERFYAGVVPVGLAFICLYLSFSVASLFAAVAGIGALAVMYFVTFFPVGLRLLILCLIGLFVGSLVMAIIALDIDVIGSLLAAVDKNPTLTGRTDIWGLGIERGFDDPFLGYGYKAFWQAGNVYAERYWELFQSPTENSFHFHNLYLESFVQLGGFGFVFFALLFTYAFAKCILLICEHGMQMQLVICLAFVTMFFVRSLVEVELLGPFGVRVFVFYVLFQKLLEYKLQAKPAGA